VANRQAFEIPLSEITNTNLASKNEVSVEFAQAEGLSKEDSLVEMRIYVPGLTTIENAEEGNSGEEGEKQVGGAAVSCGL
jgi:structure-specific recognition protein 1